jgi:hypothetical protein
MESKVRRLEIAADIASRSPADIQWSPQPGPQQQAIESEADIVFYGGAAGGGKTDMLLGCAIKLHRHSIIFRREFPQLKAIEDRARSIIGDAGSYSETTKVYRLPRNGKLEFGAVQLEDDKQKYQGRPHDFIGFDEASQFTETQFRFLMGWLRSAVPGQRCRVVCAGNPPMTAEGDWIIRFFAPWLDQQHPNPAMPGELRWFTTIDGVETEVESGEPFEHNGELLKPLSRTFIPALLSDNAYLSATGYGSTLQSLPEPMRSQLLYGSFAASQSDDAMQVIPTAWIIAAQARWTASGGSDSPMTVMGVDVARGGKDRTVLTPRHGTWVAEQRIYPGTDTPNGQTVAGLVLTQIKDKPAIHVDVIGVGASVYDILYDQLPDVRAMHASEKSKAKDRSGKLTFVNQRAEWWWLAREALDPEFGDNIALPPGRALLADLTAPRWKMRTNGIQIEAKDEIIKRIGRSPDLGDSCVYALAKPTFGSFGGFEFYRQAAEEQEPGITVRVKREIETDRQKYDRTDEKRLSWP